MGMTTQKKLLTQFRERSNLSEDLTIYAELVNAELRKADWFADGYDDVPKMTLIGWELRDVDLDRTFLVCIITVLFRSFGIRNSQEANQLLRAYGHNELTTSEVVALMSQEKIGRPTIT